MTDGETTLVDGALGGVAGTATMSALMLAAQRAGLMGQQPPEKIAEAAVHRAGVRGLSGGQQNALAVAGHFGFGASMGMAFGLLHRRLGRRVPAVVGGGLFGVAVWAGAYRGVVPALGIMPHPETDRPGRPTSMVLAHVVWGATMGWVVGRRGASASDG